MSDVIKLGNLAFFRFGPGSSSGLNINLIAGWVRAGSGVDEALVRVDMAGGNSRGLSQSEFEALLRHMESAPDGDDGVTAALYAALDAVMKHGGESADEWIDKRYYDQALAALAKARGRV